MAASNAKRQRLNVTAASTSADKGWCDLDMTTSGTIVLSCGDGSAGQLGHGDAHMTGTKPRRVDLEGVLGAGRRVVAVAAGGMHSVLLTDQAKVYICGPNDNGTIPPPAEGSNKFVEVDMSALTDTHGSVVQLVAGGGFTAVRTSKGSVIAWGYLHADELMGGHSLLLSMRERVTVLLDYRQPQGPMVHISAGDNHLLAIHQSRKYLYTFGDGEQGQLLRCAPGRSQRAGTQFGMDSARFTIPPKYRKSIKNVFCTAHGSLITLDDPVKHPVLVGGLNNYGQLGVPLGPNERDSEQDIKDRGDKTKEAQCLVKLSPALSGTHDWRQIAGDHHAALLNTNGEVFCIGRNVDDRLGQGTYESDEDDWRRFTLCQVKLPSACVYLDACQALTVAVLTDGSCYAWGQNAVGMAGVGQEELLPEPERCVSKHLDGLKVKMVACGSQHTLFLAEPINAEDDDE